MRIRLIGVCLSLLWLSGCYLLQQGKGQLELRYSQVSLSKALEQEVNPEYRQLFKEIPRIKSFAENKLLLKKSDNYTGYYETAQAGITFVVTVSPKNRLEAYTWWFPIVGSVPYKGYFHEEDAKALEREFQQQGYDTWVFAAPAYSTLGWFKDPITTPMLRKGLYYLTNTIIHEMTHVTLFVPGEEAFNEQLASFIGQRGALHYFKAHSLLTPEQLVALETRIRKTKRFSETVRSYLPRFRELYKRQQSLEMTLQQREILFSELSTEMGQMYPHLSKRSLHFNNARLLQYQRYTAESPLLIKLWQESDKDWGRFWERVKVYGDNIQSAQNRQSQMLTRNVENISDWE